MLTSLLEHSVLQCFRTAFVNFQPHVRLEPKQTFVFAFTFLAILNVFYELNTVEAADGG